MRLYRAVQSKLLQGDISGAVRAISSDSSVAPRCDTVLNQLRSKHPRTPADIRAIPTLDTVPPIPITPAEFSAALGSFAPSSSGGLDGLKPIHLRDLVSPITLDSGRDLLSSITRLCSRIVSGTIPAVARELLFSAGLIALKKAEGGVRPIAIGNVFRRLSAKIMSFRVVPTLSSEFLPFQYGVGVKGACEILAHGTRQLLHSKPNDCEFIVKLDVSNAFNCVRRDHMFEVVSKRCPELWPIVNLAYSSPSCLLFHGETIMSECGIQQGDPLGPLLFALSVDHIARNLASNVNFWYLDDITIGGPLDVVMEDINKITSGFAEIGLSLNGRKCELVNISLSSGALSQASSSLRGLIAGLRLTPTNDLVILGSPISEHGILKSLLSKLEEIKLLTERIRGLDSHMAFFLLRNFLFIPRLTYILRSSPCFVAPDALLAIDNLILTSLRFKPPEKVNERSTLGIEVEVVVGKKYYLSIRSIVYVTTVKGPNIIGCKDMCDL
ncbi:uncharacterized protein LOC115228505 [Octopus sinensis]|uniref:Uncharacterized protein LOC115228505 n=1 Tax=Octopus sinensis TaxID=2607531 RepID=A0A6P7TT58_9MOLL|nr:uncharacterized protein LOC115228505 [Octopus sinensis]